MVNSRRLAINMFAGVFNSFGKVGIQLVMLPVMARLLGPEELGLATLAFPMLNFVLLLSDAGLGNSLAREKQGESAVWSSAFWGLLGLSLALALFAYGASFFVAAAAKQPRLPGFMIPLCCAIVFFGATVIPSALMTREGKNFYGSLFDLAANVVAAIIAISMALHGAGVWAMAAQTLSLYIVRFVLYNFTYPFLPKFEFKPKTLAGHMGIGGALVGARLIDAAGRLWENAIVSRHLGAASLGAYGYANQIGKFFAEAMSSSVWANLYYLSINRPEEKAVGDYLRSQRMLAMTLLPGSALLAPLLPTFVPLLFGPRWEESIRPMMVLLISYPFMAKGGLISAILLARGQTGFTLISTPALNAARVIVVWTMYPLGLFAVACGVAITNVLLYIVGSIVASRTLGNPLKEHFEVMQGPLLAAAAAGLGLHAALGPSPSFLWAVMAGAGGAIFYALVLFVIDGARTKADLSAVYSVVKGKLA